MDGTGGRIRTAWATLMGLEGNAKVTAELKMFFNIYFRRGVTLCRSMESL